MGGRLHGGSLHLLGLALAQAGQLQVGVLQPPLQLRLVRFLPRPPRLCRRSTSNMVLRRKCRMSQQRMRDLREQWWCILLLGLANIGCCCHVRRVPSLITRQLDHLQRLQMQRSPQCVPPQAAPVQRRAARPGGGNARLHLQGPAARLPAAPRPLAASRTSPCACMPRSMFVRPVMAHPDLPQQGPRKGGANRLPSKGCHP